MKSPRAPAFTKRLHISLNTMLIDFFVLDGLGSHHINAEMCPCLSFDIPKHPNNSIRIYHLFNPVLFIRLSNFDVLKDLT